ncbi:MAG: MCE family protein [Caulobacteraceae bacterium]|nr:MCE family protein [Caulobacter sp.]
MSDTPSPPRDEPRKHEPPRRTTAREAVGKWPGIVWAVPLAAIIIVGYLALRAYANQGVDVVVSFPNAAGAVAGDTKVIYKGLEAGRVTKIVIAKDGQRVNMTLRLDPRTKPVLRTGTQFWLVGANPSLTDVASLKAAVAGVSIGMAPGPGKPTRKFRGLDRTPPVISGTPGRYYWLTAKQVGSMRAGASVFYHGLDVGKVAEIILASPQVFRIHIFVDAPNDTLVRPDSLFWMASPVTISLTGGAISTQFAPANAALVGGVEFDTPERYASEPQSPPNAEFELYQDKGKALAGDRGPQVLYDLAFKGPVGDIDEGTPVSLAGRQIGAVKQVRFALDGRTGVVSQPITIAVQPTRLNLTDTATPPVNGDWRGVTDQAFRALLARGYRVRLSQNPPLIGPRAVEIALVPKPAPGAIVYGQGPNPRLPTVTPADASGLMDKASDILDKVDAIPLQEIGENVRKLTANLNDLTGSPKVKDSLDHLDSTLNQVDQMVKKVNPQVGPLITKLNTAADQLSQTAAAANGVLSGEGASQDASLPGAIRELTDAARSIRSLTDYLGRHPEAVLRGKVKDRK